MTPHTEAVERADALAERLFGATLGALELFSVYLGVELGLYRALERHGALTPEELADRAGIAPALRPRVARAAGRRRLPRGRATRRRAAARWPPTTPACSCTRTTRPTSPRSPTCWPASAACSRAWPRPTAPAAASPTRPTAPSSATARATSTGPRSPTSCPASGWTRCPTSSLRLRESGAARGRRRLRPGLVEHRGGAGVPARARRRLRRRPRLDRRRAPPRGRGRRRRPRALLEGDAAASPAARTTS